MQEDGFTKKDWQLFREKLPAWQEAYMDKLNQEYIELLREDALPSDKFWRLAKRIREDRRKAGVHLEIRRSGFFYALVSLLNEGAIQMDDLNDFSDDVNINNLIIPKNA